MSAPRIPPYIFVCWFCLLLFEICLLVEKEWAGCGPFSFQDERIWVYCKWRTCVQGGFQRWQRWWAFANLSVKISLVLAFSTFSLVRADSIRPLILHVWCGRWNLQDAMSLWYHGPMQKGETLRRIWKLYFSLYLRCFCENRTHTVYRTEHVVTQRFTFSCWESIQIFGSWWISFWLPLPS